MEIREKNLSIHLAFQNETVFPSCVLFYDPDYIPSLVPSLAPSPVPFLALFPLPVPILDTTRMYHHSSHQDYLQQVKKLEESASVSVEESMK